MNITGFKCWLKANGLKATAPRLKIFEIFSEHGSALTFPEIESSMAIHMDRVTLYRTLKTFEDHGIIHRITGNNGTANFALTQADWNQQKEGLAMQHLHFSCVRCKSMYCMDHPAMPEVVLPDAYQVESLTIIISGICDRCSK